MIITQLDGQRCTVLPLEDLAVWQNEMLKAAVVKLATKDAKEPKQKPLKIIETPMIIKAIQRPRNNTGTNTLQKMGLEQYALDLCEYYGDAQTRSIYCAILQGNKRDLEYFGTKPTPETIEFRGVHLPVRTVVFGLLLAIALADAIDVVSNRSPLSRMPVMTFLADMKKYLASEIRKCYTRGFRELEATRMASGKPYADGRGGVIIYTSPEVYEELLQPNEKSVDQRIQSIVERAADFNWGLGEIEAA